MVRRTTRRRANSAEELTGFPGEEDRSEKRKDPEIIRISREIRDTTHAGSPDVETEEERVFTRCLQALNLAEIPYVVGGAFARNAYTGIWRTTKDLDVFLAPQDLKSALDELEKDGFRSEILFHHWLAKAYYGSPFVDLIFGTGHGNLNVDRSWIERGRRAEILDVKTKILGVEEMIASAVFVAERNRFDGAEVAHLIRGMKGQIDWERILNLLGENKELLLWHLIFFDFLYPGHSSYLPKNIMEKIFLEAQSRWKDRGASARSSLGTVLDPFSFAVTIDQWDYQDSRKLTPLVNQDGDYLPNNGRME